MPSWNLEYHPVVFAYNEYPPDDFADLVEDIRANGLINPVVLYNGKIIDGRHRYRAMTILGIEVSVEAGTAVEIGNKVSDLYAYVISANSQRRNQNDSQKRASIAEVITLKQAEGVKQVSAGRPSLDAEGNKTKETWKDVVEEHPEFSDRSIRRAVRVAQESPVLQDLVKQGEITTGQAENYLKEDPATIEHAAARFEDGLADSFKDAVKNLKQEKAADKAAEWLAATPKSGRYELHKVTCRGLIDKVEANSLDYIITDPPYPGPLMEVWEELRDFAVYALRPKGMMIVLTGHYSLPRVLDSLRHPDLNWRGFIAYRWENAHPTPQQDGGSFMDSTRINLVYHKQQTDFRFDTYIPNYVGYDKEPGGHSQFHKWQQSLNGYRALVEALKLEPASRICDPFMCSGTTGVAVLEEGHYFIGGEPDVSMHITAEERLIKAVS